MGVEIERKFLVDTTRWQPDSSAVRYVQGYMSRVPQPTVRVRIAGEKAFLTIKGKNCGIARTEFEYPIPLADAEAMLENLCEHPLIDKHRCRVPFGGHVWEVDVFHGENEGLVVAEVELESEDQPFEKPDWVLEEVSGDPRYYNSSLQENPFCNWKR